MTHRRRGRAQGPRSSASRPTPRARRRRPSADGRSAATAAPGPACTRAWSSSSARTARRSSSSTAAASPSAWPRRSNDVAGEELALAHHGSRRAREARGDRAAPQGRTAARHRRDLVARARHRHGRRRPRRADRVAPDASPRGLQRVGRACHGVGGVPRGVLLPKHRHDLLACAAAARSMRAGEVEETFYPRNPLDVLAQQIVAMVADRPAVGRRALRPRARRRAVRRAAARRLRGRARHAERALPLRRLRRAASAHHLGPRARPSSRPARAPPPRGHQRAAPSPTAACYGVFTAAPAEGETGRRVGELDEEMVFELREGEVFLLGASSWRADGSRHDRVLVSPAAGEPGKMPFWHGDRPGRARAFGDAHRRARPRASPTGTPRPRPAARRATRSTLRRPTRSSPTCARRSRRRARSRATRRWSSSGSSTSVGDWRVVVLCPLGTRVLAPWATAVHGRLRERYVDVDLHYTDDGMAFRIPACDEPPPARAVLPLARRDRGAGHPRARRHGALRRALPRVRGARAAVAPPAIPGGARPSGRSASARATCSRSPRSTRLSRSSSRPTASACATCSICRGS